MFSWRNKKSVYLDNPLIWSCGIYKILFQGLVLNNASTYCFGPNEIYLLRVMVRVNIEMNSTGGTVKESKPTHMMVLTEGIISNL